MLPDILADDFDFSMTLFGVDTPPDRDGGAAGGRALADALEVPEAPRDAPELPVPPVAAGAAGVPEGLPSVSPWGADASSAIIVEWVEVSPFATHAGNHGGGGGSDGGGGKPDKGGGGGKPGGNGSSGTLYYSDAGAAATAETYDTAGFDIVISFEGKGWTDVLIGASTARRTTL